jgi:DNA primase
MPWTINKFGLAYSYKYKRNIIPLRYWLDGRLLGFNARTTVENYELFDIKKYFITPNYPKHLNLFGLWENHESILKAGYVTVVESEKSVLKRDSLCDSTLVALSGHSISDEQVRILIGLGVKIIVALDRDVDRQEVRHICEKFYGIRPVYYIWDKYDLLKSKDSPADAKNKIFEYLMEYKIKYDDSEHKEYLKGLKSR